MPVANANHWQFSRWVYVIGRSLRLEGGITAPERSAIETFIQRVGNPTTGSRPWLADRLRIKCNNPVAGGNPVIAAQSDYSEAKMIQVIGKDLKKIPMTVVEKGWCDTFITATGNRRYGAKGNTI